MTPPTHRDERIGVIVQRMSEQSAWISMDIASADRRGHDPALQDPVRNVSIYFSARIPAFLARDRQLSVSWAKEALMALLRTTTTMSQPVLKEASLRR